MAGTFTALYEAITDQAVAERVRACGPWVPARLRQMCPMATIESLAAGRRLVVLAARSMQAPGATGTAQRLHSAMALVSWQCREVLVSEVHTGETLKPFTFAPGASAGAERGYAPGQGLRAALQQGADLIVRLPPFRVVLGDARGAPLERCAALKRQRLETRRTLVVTRRATGGQPEVRGWVQA